MSQLFISYSRADEAFARQLAHSLLAADADAWLDQEDIRSGEDWSDAIQRGLERSQIMLLILSPDSMASSNVADEWKYYHSQKKPIIPLLWKPTPVHFQLQRLQYVDFHTQAYEVALNQLYRALTSQAVSLSVTPPTPSSPLAMPAPVLPAQPESQAELHLSSKWGADKGDFQMESKMAFNPRTASARGRDWWGEALRVLLAIIAVLVILLAVYLILNGG
jgi:hypothetical protein